MKAKSVEEMEAWLEEEKLTLLHYLGNVECAIEDAMTSVKELRKLFEKNWASVVVVE